MASNDPEIAVDISPLIRIYKDGRVERLMGTATIPASTDPVTGVESKDVVISPETGVAARLYLPKITNPAQKIPLLVYFHGGAFCIESAFSPTYHHYLNSLVAAAKVVAVSVEYRLAPEHPFPAFLDDCWTGVQWVASHSTRQGTEPWLNNHTDFDRIFFAGDSAGATITHHMALKAGIEGLPGVKLVGIILYHPYFWGTEPVGTETRDPAKRAKVNALWRLAHPGTSGCDDPVLNPAFDTRLGKMGCARALICISEKDILKDRGWYYYEVLKKEYGGAVEVMELKGEDHVFHLFRPDCENAVALLKRVADFLNE